MFFCSFHRVARPVGYKDRNSVADFILAVEQRLEITATARSKNGNVEFTAQWKSLNPIPELACLSGRYLSLIECYVRQKAVDFSSFVKHHYVNN